VTATDRADAAIDDELPTHQLYTSAEVSAMTKDAVSPYWLEKQARLEAIPARKVGRSWRWTADDVEVLFQTCLRTPRQRPRR